MITQKYIDRAKERAERGLPIGDMCEYCLSSDRKKDNTCGKCGAPMKPLIGYVFGMPIDEEDAAEILNNQFIYAGTAVIPKR